MPAADSPAAGVGEAVRFGWFDGILEGSTSDPGAVGAAVDALNRAGPARVSLLVESMRCSILADDRPIAGERFRDPACAEDFLRALEAVVARLDGPDAPESTLRCTLVREGAVHETLFPVRGRAVRPVGRERPVLDADLARAPRADGAGATFRGASRRTAVAVALLLLLGAGLSAWQGGLLERFLAAKAEALALATGPFGDGLEVRAERSWGGYRVSVRRGRGYPADGPEATRRETEAASAAERAAARLVANGDTIFIRLVDAKGAVLASRPVSLRALLAHADGAATAELPGRRRAARVELALEDAAGGEGQ